MAKFHYDVTGAEPIIRDIAYINGGAALARETVMSAATVGTEGCIMESADADVLDNIIGVTNEDIAAANNSVIATGVTYYAKTIINPFAVYLCKYSQLAADDVPLTATDATGKSVTITQVTNHLRCWAYITSLVSPVGTGFGNLFCVGAITSTTVLTAMTSYDDNLSGNVSTDTCIVLHAPYGADVAGGSVDLATNRIDVSGHDASASAGAAIVLENYIASRTRPMEALRPSVHSGYNYKSEAPDFYADVMFSEHLLAAGGVVNTRIIT